ncbi:FAD-dependent oxidoreductase [Allorhizobium undicola]|uniref:FAD-dependent oxidoreductase n=1 Tax=Allorhizobium undicola TaxID=78527 RepID=UPI003D3302FD
MNGLERMAAESDVYADCVIAGAGPGGLMLGYLLARAGIDVVVIEKHADFLRDFRGDTIHPSTLEVMRELGLLDELLRLPHTKAPKLHAEIGGRDVTIADFSRLPTACRFIAFMPQWDFLSFLAEKAKATGHFRLLMETRVVDLLQDGKRVSGLVVSSGSARQRIHARLVVGADGRHSVVRARAGLSVESFGSPSDVVWMKLSHLATDPPYTMGHGGPRQGFVMIDRGDYWQCGYVVRKGSFEDIKEKGLDAFRAAVAAVSPLPAARMQEIRSFDDVSLLSIRIDRLTQWWRPGLVCIGDAAHAMSPIGGVGVNLAIQDAVAAANLLAAPLKGGEALEPALSALQKRRQFPTVATQKMQLMMRRKPKEKERPRQGPPGFIKAIARLPLLAHLAGRLIGLGFRPEHVTLFPSIGPKSGNRFSGGSDA